MRWDRGIFNGSLGQSLDNHRTMAGGMADYTTPQISHGIERWFYTVLVMKEQGLGQWDGVKNMRGWD